MTAYVLVQTATQDGSPAGFGSPGSCSPRTSRALRRPRLARSDVMGDAFKTILDQIRGLPDPRARGSGRA